MKKPNSGRRAKPGRLEEILKAALCLASEPNGWATITRDAIANAAGCSNATINQYYSTMPQLKRAIMRHAIDDRNLSVIAQGLAARDDLTRKIPECLKREALQTLI